VKTPGRDQAEPGVGEQLHLIDPPPFSPKWPNRSTLSHVALTAMLRGEMWTHPEFQTVTRSWRLAEPIRALRHDFGWPVETQRIAAPCAERPDRTIARYVLPAWVIAATKAAL
jgi:hypothetical protein